jgi:hypothetical protein
MAQLSPHSLRHTEITMTLQVAAERGMPLPDVLPSTGHARGIGEGRRG